MQSIGARLVVSHILGILLITPLMGFGLIYLLQSQFILGNYSDGLVAQGQLMADLVRTHPEVWNDNEEAVDFIEAEHMPDSEAVTLIDAAGRVLASTDSDDRQFLGRVLSSPDLAPTLAGQIRARAVLVQSGIDREVAEALVPVRDTTGHIIGAVRVTQRLSSVLDQFARLRYIIGAVLLIALLLEILIGWGLALQLRGPLADVAGAVERLSVGGLLKPLPERGPSEIRQLARGINYLVARLDTLEVARRELRAKIVHELGRPVGAMLSAIQALQMGADQDERFREELLEGLAQEAARLKLTLRELAQIHNLLLDPVRVDPRPTDLTTWLKPILAPWREAARARGLDWQEVLPATLPLVPLDPDRMAQAVENLLSNAIKYTPSGGSVRIEAGCENQSAWIRVSDTGPGIPPHEQGAIFEPFYQVRRGPSTSEGMGLGLGITRDLVQAHGGQLELESEPGKGSTFTIRIGDSAPPATTSPARG